MKLLILSPVAYSFWYQPTYSLLAVIGLLFIVQVISELIHPKTPTNNSYEEIKELFKQYDNITSKDINLEDTTYAVQNSWEVKCQPLDFTNYTYREVQSFCKSLGVPKVNRKRVVLEEELLALCN